MNICELIKNHIKNYIKIMGLAAVPFGTAQAGNDKMEIKCKEENDATHFRISFGRDGKDLGTVEFTWSYGEELPEVLSFRGCFDKSCKYCFPKKTTVFLNYESRGQLYNVLTFKDKQDAEKFCVAYRGGKVERMRGCERDDCQRYGAEVWCDRHSYAKFFQIEMFKKLYHKGKVSEDELRSMADCVAKIDTIKCTSESVIEVVKDKEASIETFAGNCIANELEKGRFYEEWEKWGSVRKCIEVYHYRRRLEDGCVAGLRRVPLAGLDLMFYIKRENIFPKPKYLVWIDSDYPELFPIVSSDVPVRLYPRCYFNHLLLRESTLAIEESPEGNVLILEGHCNWKTANEMDSFTKYFRGLFVHVERVRFGCKKSEHINKDGVGEKYIEIRKDKKEGPTLDDVLENAKEVLVIDFALRFFGRERKEVKVFVTTEGMEDKVFETPEDVIKFAHENKFYEKNEMGNEIEEEPKESKKQKEVKKEDKKIEEDLFEPKKKEDKKSTFTPLPLPMKYMGDDC